MKWEMTSEKNKSTAKKKGTTTMNRQQRPRKTQHDTTQTHIASPLQSTPGTDRDRATAGTTQGPVECCGVEIALQCNRSVDAIPFHSMFDNARYPVFFRTRTRTQHVMT
mmetsp:Transcript_25932/g.29496  ORF Transcript_25932/g.29496 Transcript_25932/m.29496 type:complete len:109 (-) Transcript_25932:200-526(-)